MEIWTEVLFTKIWFDREKPKTNKNKTKRNEIRFAGSWQNVPKANGHPKTKKPQRRTLASRSSSEHMVQTIILHNI